MFKIKNEYLTVAIHEKGATLWSVKDIDGMEYLWQGNPKYWGDRAPNLFPYIARMTEGKYTLNGKTYEMDIHGFAKDMIFGAEQISGEHIVFSICDTKETYDQYPYKFQFSVSYKLDETRLCITYSVKNTDEKEMYFGVGGHPGFNVPLDKDTVFEDYYLEFGECEDAKRVVFSEDCFVTGELVAFPLEEGARLPLCHDMFDDDAIVLTDVAHSVTLKSDKNSRAVRITYPDMPYLGLWHMPKTNAPYICIEPWSSLPSRKGIVEALAKQPSLIRLDPQCIYENEFSIEIKKELFLHQKHTVDTLSQMERR